MFACGGVDAQNGRHNASIGEENEEDGSKAVCDIRPGQHSEIGGAG